MWRLYRNKQRKLEFAFVEKNGEYVCGTNQGYENRTDVMKMFSKLGVHHYQDETKEEVVCFVLGSKEPNQFIKPYPRYKKYIPELKHKVK